MLRGTPCAFRIQNIECESHDRSWIIIPYRLSHEPPQPSTPKYKSPKSKDNGQERILRQRRNDDEDDIPRRRVVYDHNGNVIS